MALAASATAAASSSSGPPEKTAPFASADAFSSDMTTYGLAAIGVTLIASGFSYALLHVWVHHPYLLAISLGVLLCCYCAYRELIRLCNSPGGLAAQLSPELQEQLRTTTLYWLIIDDTGFQNFLRRWGRIFLLQMAGSERQVSSIIGEMEPDFLESVMRRPAVEMLPTFCQRLLYGASAQSGLESPKAEKREALMPADVLQIIQDAQEARDKGITEPDITKAAIEALAVIPAMEVAGSAGWRMLQVGLATGTAWIAAILVGFASPPRSIARVAEVVGRLAARCTQLVSKSTEGAALAVREPRDLRRLVACAAVVGLGGAVLFASLTTEKVKAKGKEARTHTGSRMGEPDSEASPDESEN
eukprot:TRINITY_DN22819_c0_g1_i1.p1 TRINITY_DN22819_c0_g1~~TRINITY_DN22819_c0_g1_i1.p1  ORF type:complete len:390 (-),score=61.40 TRINITY_DN22819_c0_g1_i1:80-1159(-)